uniref:Uncharacterized protein n=1 Tax=Arundo donax TaxID=35708 RepID=A0A0A9G8G3_ARUDO
MKHAPEILMSHFRFINTDRIKFRFN